MAMFLAQPATDNVCMHIYRFLYNATSSSSTIQVTAKNSRREERDRSWLALAVASNIKGGETEQEKEKSVVLVDNGDDDYDDGSGGDYGDGGGGSSNDLAAQAKEKEEVVWNKRDKVSLASRVR